MRRDTRLGSVGPPAWLCDVEFELWRERRELALADLKRQLRAKRLTANKKRDLLNAIALWEADLRAWHVASEGRH